jgi:hypothetical protein
MAKPAEIKLRPGWLANDVKRAQSRLDQWTGASERATALLPTQANAMERARQLSANSGTHVEPVRNSTEGGQINGTRASAPYANE